MYSLKQAPRVWLEKFQSTLFGFFFTQSQHDSSLFLQRTSTDIVVLLVYRGNIFVTISDMEGISEIQKLLHSTIHMKDFGHLTYFLGLEVHHRPQGIFLNQHKYIQDQVQLARLTSTNFVDTPMELNVKYRCDEEELLLHPTFYRKLVVSLIYLTITRPNISYIVHTVSKFMQAPRHLHLYIVRCIIRYILGTPSLGLFFSTSFSLQLQIYSDVDWASCVDTRKSTTRWCMFLGDALNS